MLKSALLAMLVAGFSIAGCAQAQPEMGSSQFEETDKSDGGGGGGSM